MFSVVVLQNLWDNIDEFEASTQYNGIFKMVSVNYNLTTDSVRIRASIIVVEGIKSVLADLVLVPRDYWLDECGLLPFASV